jgi:hypothetical protein
MFALWDGHWEIFEALELSLWNATEPLSMQTRPEVAETRALALSQIALNSETLEPEVVFRLCVHAVRRHRLRRDTLSVNLGARMAPRVGGSAKAGHTMRGARLSLAQ